MSKCNNQCGSSTGIHEGLTFGSGKLNEFGYWSKPCQICARDWDARRPEVKLRIEEEQRLAHPELSDEEFNCHMKLQHPWLFIPGWPFAEEENES
jgi:hypothetical protein